MISPSWRVALSQENTRPALAPLQHRQRSDMVLVCVGDDDCVDGIVGQKLELRQSLRAIELRMHPAVEDQPPSPKVQNVRIGADLNRTRQPCE
jgi:hypothetical protein